MHLIPALATPALAFWLATSGVSAQVVPSNFSVPDDVTMRSATIMSEGTRIAAEVFAPKKPKTDKLPTIVMSHGWGGTSAALRPDGVAFARAGYLVVTFDYRGWGKSDSRLVLVGDKPGEEGRQADRRGEGGIRAGGRSDRPDHRYP